MTHNKRLPAPKHYPIERKQGKYVSGIKGSRSKKSAIPAVMFLREVTEYADSAKEARKIVQKGKILRNGETLRDAKQGIGTLDVVELPDAEESYRAVRVGDEMAFVPVEDSEKSAGKIVDKRTENGEFVYSLHNGENYQSEKDYDTGTTLVFDNSGVRDLPLEEGARVLATEGGHAGETGEVVSINSRGFDRDTVEVSGETEFETKKDNVAPIGDLEVSGQ
ncbi:MAG: hypothetical protein ABEJ03_02735 [Candidatus Nanohaloarchaea archaeon]